jgi:hypothetical protein
VIRIVLAFLLVAALAAPAASAAKPVAYTGKTSGGSSITLKRSGSQVKALRTVVPTVCVETTGSGQTRAGSELYRPPGAFTLGKERKVKALQPAAMNSGTKATKNYTVKVTSSGSKLKGKLRLSFSFLRLDLFRTLPYTFICTGTAKFTAKPR